MVPGETTSLVPSQMGISAAEEPRVVCIIRDMTNAETQSAITLTLPVSTKAKTLMEEVGNQLGYMQGTFNLNYEVSSNGEVHEMPLSQCPESALGEICGSTRRNKFVVMDKDGVQPVKTEVTQSEDNSHVLLSSLSLGSSSCPTQDTVGTSLPTSGNSASYTSSDHGYSMASSLIKSETGFVGLVNQAMTCYLNSLLQTLYMTPEFRNAIYRWEYDGTEDELVRSIPYQLQRLFLQLQTSKRRAIETTDITKSFGWDSSESWQQHDVQELCRVMFDALEKKWQNTDQRDLINQLYQGKMKDYVKCLECGYESARSDSFLDIPLTVRPFGSQKAYESVEEALHAFVSPEILDGNNQYSCEKCNKKCNAHKGLKFLSFPYLLTLQMKRFDFDYSTMHRIKLNDRMTFPEILNLNELVDICDESKGTDKSQSLPSAVPNGVDADKESLGEENDEGIDPGYSTSGTSVNSDSLSPSDAEAATNTRNAQDSQNTGPFVYELFSIMIHSGSAAGGHYYAYIKSFKDGLWYSFNDQHVTPITYDDIQKTYGGSPSNRGYYSSAFSSSTNAYMLMYRQIDKERNRDYLNVEGFPEHLKKALQHIKDREEREKRQRELDRCTCKIKLFCFHPVHQKLCETRLEIHKDKTLKDATEVAWKLFELEDIAPLDCTRIVRYDEAYDWIERSFDSEDDTTMSVLLGSVKSIYTFDLLLEVKRPEQKFVEYKPGGVTVKVFLVDIKNETINPPFTIRAYLTQTIAEFKGLIAQAMDITPERVRCVLEKYYNELKLLTVPNKSLKAEGFIRSNKVFIECSGDEDESTPFSQTLLYKLLDRYENTIRILVGLPPFDPNGKAENGISREVTPEKVSEDKEIDEGIGEAESETRIKDGSVKSENKESSSKNSQNNSEDDGNLPLVVNEQTQQTSDQTDSKEETKEGSASGAQQDAENWDEENGTDDKNNDEEYRQYFTASMQIDTQSGERLLTVCVDKRITLGAFKKELEPYVGLPADHFRMYRVYGNNQELETSRLSDTLSSFGDDNKINIKLGRALKKGEHRVKVYSLQLNDPEPCKYLFETIFCQGMTVLEAKKLLSEEMQVQGGKKAPDDRLRIRKKTWRNPGNIYLDSQTFEDHLQSLTNWEIFLEVLPGPEPVKASSQLSVYVRRWWPSKYQIDGLTEVVLDHHTVAELKEHISELSGIEVTNVEFAKGRGTFPCDMSVLDIHKELDWEPDVTTLNVWPLHIYEDGYVIYYRDKNEELAELSEEQKKKLEEKESSRSSKFSTRVSYSPRKERALKIYTDDTPQPSTNNLSSAAKGASEFEPSTKISMTSGSQLTLGSCN